MSTNNNSLGYSFNNKEKAYSHQSTNKTQPNSANKSQNTYSIYESVNRKDSEKRNNESVDNKQIQGTIGNKSISKFSLTLASDFYKSYLENLKFSYFNDDTIKPDTQINTRQSINRRSDNKDANKDMLNESFSTNNTFYTLTSHKGNLNRQMLRSIYDTYLETKYPDIFKLQTIYSTPYSILDIKKNSTFFIIKSFNIDNIHKAIKYGVWSTTYSGNILFDKAYSNAQLKGGEVYLFFSTNSTFAFQGIARLKSKFHQNKTYNFWKGSDKYKFFNGSFSIDWVIIKDVPNASLDRIQINNIPFSKLRNGVEISEKEALLAVHIYQKFYYCSSLVLSDFMRLDIEEKHQFGESSRKSSTVNS